MATAHGCLRGRIELITGPMFSGKTTELLRRLKRYEVARHKCLIIKYANDPRRMFDNVITHDNQRQLAFSATTLTELKDRLVTNYSVIAIDEGHFFPDIVSFAEEMAQRDTVVIIAALDGTFERKAFHHVLQLIPLAESVIKLTAVCMMCFRDASFTKRIGTDTQVEMIGGIDRYMSVCRKCHSCDVSQV